MRSEGESTISGRAHRVLIKVKRCTTDGLLGVKRKCRESVRRFYPHDDKMFLPLLARSGVIYGTAKMKEDSVVSRSCVPHDKKKCVKHESQVKSLQSNHAYFSFFFC